MYTYYSIVTRSLSLTFVLLFALHLNGWTQQSTTFELVADPVNEQAKSIKKRILEVEKGINKSDRWKDFSMTGEHPAIGILNYLVDSQNIRSLWAAPKVYLINNGNHTYQVQDLYVKTAQSAPFDYRQLELQFNEHAELIGARLSPNIYNYQQVLDRGIHPDKNKTEEIRTLVEQFQKGLSNNDPKAIQSLLNADAQLTEGSIVRYTHNGEYGPYYHYQSVNYQDYLAKFKDASIPPSIKYDQLRVYAHTFLDDVYIATFKQTWQRSTYSDTGYVAMIFDMKEDQPIQLRRWQEHPYNTGRLKYEIAPANPVAMSLGSTSTASGLESVALPVSQDDEKTEAASVQSNKNRWLILAGTTAAISVGVAILSGSGSSDLPGPPGRPALR